MTTTAVCYITDRNYLFPTLMSAIQARGHTTPGLADVLVFCTDADERTFDAFAAAYASEGIRLRRIDETSAALCEEIRAASPQTFAGRYSISIFGRLFLHALLPATYTDFLYIDGDTQISDSLDPLLRQQVPPGKFYAGRDYCSIVAPVRRYADFEAHLDRLGLQGMARTRYFNSGVIRSTRESWRAIAEAALAYYVERPARCEPFADQGALNGACRGAHLLMSSRWNFPRHFLHLRTSDLRPAICHFMACPKPWQGVFHPWRREQHACYGALLREQPQLRRYVPALPAMKGFAYKVRSIRDRARDMRTAAAEQSLIDAEAAADAFEAVRASSHPATLSAA